MSASYLNSFIASFCLPSLTHLALPLAPEASHFGSSQLVRWSPSCLRPEEARLFLWAIGFKRRGSEGRQSPRNTVCCSAEPYGDEVQTSVRRLLTDTDIAVKGFDNVNQKKKLPFDSSLSNCYWRRGRVHQGVDHECRVGRYRDIRTLLLRAPRNWQSPMRWLSFVLGVLDDWALLRARLWDGRIPITGLWHYSTCHMDRDVFLLLHIGGERTQPVGDSRWSFVDLLLRMCCFSS